MVNNEKYHLFQQLNTFVPLAFITLSPLATIICSPSENIISSKVMIRRNLQVDDLQNDTPPLTSHSPSSPMPSHPYQNLINDILNIIFEYYIQDVAEDAFSREELGFFRRHIRCWSFKSYEEGFSVTEFLRRTRGNKRSLFYVEAYHRSRVDSETFKYFRGIRELHISPWQQEISFQDKDFDNLRGIHTLNISSFDHITDAALVNLRGIHTLCIGQCTKITDAGLENLRGIHTLDFTNCKEITDTGLENLRGVKVLCLGFGQWTDKGLENLRGIEKLHLEKCRPLSRDAFANLRSLKELSLNQLSRDTITSEDHFENLVGLEVFELWSPLHCISNFTGKALRHLRGLKHLAASTGRYPLEESFVMHIPQMLESLSLAKCAFTSQNLHVLYGTKRILVSQLSIGKERLEHAKHCLKHARMVNAQFVGDGADELIEYLKGRSCRVFARRHSTNT